MIKIAFVLINYLLKKQEYSFWKMIIHQKYENEIIFIYLRTEIKFSLLNPYSVANLFLMQ